MFVSNSGRRAARTSLVALLLFRLSFPVSAISQTVPGIGRSSSESSERRAERADEAETIPPPVANPLLGFGRALRGPVDQNMYIVGPGDAFAITVWARVAQSFSAVVTPEGHLVLPGVSTIPVAGLTLAVATAAVRTEIARQYRNVEVSVSLVELRRLEVSVVGNVLRPGTYVATALDPASVLIELAGGTGPRAGRRNIELRRRGGSVDRVDLVRYERTGDLAANPPILDGDVIVVPWTKEEVLVDGFVEMPAVYEIVAGDTVRSLLEIAGGLQRSARTDTVEIRRFVDEHHTEETLISLDGDAGWDSPLHDGDQIYVRGNVDWKIVESVVLEGEFRFPGPYGIEEGKDRLTDVIRRAAGFTELASLGEARLLRTRGMDPIDLEYERLKQIPVQDMSEEEYAYFKTKARERKGQVVVNFEKLMAGDEEEDPLLHGGDRVLAPKKLATITVSGSVTFPGLITYAEGERPSYYIELAGGYTSDANRGKARVVRGVTGEWEPFSDVKTIVPGDEIWVPEKPDRKWWQLARETVAFIASVGTVYLVIDQATN